MDYPKQQHVTLEPASSVSGTGDSSGRFQSAATRYAKNSHTDSTNVSYNMPTTVTGTETSDSGGVAYANNVCVHGQPARGSGLAACFDQQMNRSKGFRTGNNKLSVMMFMPGIAAAAMHDRQIQPELYYAATGLPSSSFLGPGIELRKRSNSFTQGQTMANFVSALDVDSEHLAHHHQLLYQPPFVFNSEVAQRTQREQRARMEQQSSGDQMTTDVRSGRMARQSSSQDSETTGDSGQRQEARTSKVNKVNFILTNQSDEEDEQAVKELNNNQPDDRPEDNADEMVAELTSQCSVVMQVASGDEESQI